MRATVNPASKVTPKLDKADVSEIEVGEDDNDDTSSFGSSINSDITSITSSVYDYVYENGRRYPSLCSRQGESMLPNDEAEQERLDLSHHFLLLMMRGNLYQSPLAETRPKRVLDLGTGTGIWAIHFADNHPYCEVVGIDLSPLQPTWIPPNLHFEIDDFEGDDWGYPDDKKFDFIHCRSLVGTVKDWPRLVKNIYDNLNPGGYAEFIETDLVRPYSEDNSLEGTSMKEYHDGLRDAGLKSGIRTDIVPEIPSYLHAAGFTDIHTQARKAPIGSWPKDRYFKELGVLAGMTAATGYQAYGLAMFTRVLGWDQEKAQRVIDDVVDCVSNRKRGVHAIYKQYVFYAQKPRAKEAVEVDT